MFSMPRFLSEHQPALFWDYLTSREPRHHLLSKESATSLVRGMASSHPRAKTSVSDARAVQQVSLSSRHIPTISVPDRRQSSIYNLSHRYPKPKEPACCDWIFSTATNVHIAIDLSLFKTYTAFPSYVLTVAEQRQVLVTGIGTVELKIKRQPESKETHIITLVDVLHVPEWMCNIVSDIHFLPPQDYDYSWNQFGCV